MKGHGAKLPRKQQEAIAALLEFPTVKHAASAVKIGEATLFRWMQLDEFQEAYREAKRRVVDQAIARLQKASGDAVQTLQSVMNDETKPSSVRVTAARVILETAIKAVEVENLETRIASLETFLNKRSGGLT